jgi:DNA-directed RNA polymerase subunit M
MLPKKKDKKLVYECASCGKVTATQSEDAKIKEVVSNANRKIDLVDGSEEEKTLPLTQTECPACKHTKAYYWTIQTRASDEPETKFMKCEKCKHI